jgi:hypothetical protein
MVLEVCLLHLCAVYIAASAKGRVRARVCICVGDLDTSTMRRLRPEFGLCATKKEKLYFFA